MDKLNSTYISLYMTFIGLNHLDRHYHFYVKHTHIAKQIPSNYCFINFALMVK